MVPRGFLFLDAIGAGEFCVHRNFASNLLLRQPTFLRYASDIESSSQQVFDLTSGLEERIWQRVQEDHRKAQRLLRRAEWVLSIVSTVVILLSVWITFTLPREIVKPLISLKDAVDDAASGNYQIEFELVQLKLLKRLS